jgi:biotin synthase
MGSTYSAWTSTWSGAGEASRRGRPLHLQPQPRSSEAYYPQIITTRTSADRLDTLAADRTTGMTVCCGGILGMGESEGDRVELLHKRAALDPHPGSVPINVLSKVEGTPLADQPDVPISATVRVIATARILMPRSDTRIAAGRDLMGLSDQALCFLAGANSFFSSERRIMLTSAVPCADHRADDAMLKTSGLRAWRPASTRT